MNLLHRLLLVLLAVGSLASCSPKEPDPAQTRDSLIAGVMEAYGGLETLQAVKGYRMVGNLKAIQTREAGTQTRWVGARDRMRVDLDYPSRTEVRFVIDGGVWTGPDLGHQEPAPPARQQSIRLQGLRLELPLRLHDFRDQVEYRGKDELGRDLLYLPVDDQLSITYFIDPATHRIVRVSTEMAGPPAMQFHADYEQFHKISGVLFAFRETTWAGPTMTAVFQASDFELNPPELENRLRVPGDA